MTSIKFESIEGIEIEQYGIWDKIWKKWDLILHQIWNSETRKVNATFPFKSAEILEEFIHGHEEHPEEKKDRFELILNALGGIVEDYLERKWIREKVDDEDELIWLELWEDIIDLRNETEKERIKEKLKKREDRNKEKSHGWDHGKHWQDHHDSHWWHH